MQGQWFFEFASDGVSGGESHQDRIIHPCPQYRQASLTGIILADFIVEPLAGEHKGIIE